MSDFEMGLETDRQQDYVFRDLKRAFEAVGEVTYSGKVSEELWMISRYVVGRFLDHFRRW
jgi:hypothetical protein